MSGFVVDPEELRAVARPLASAARDVADLAGDPAGSPDPARGELFAALARFHTAVRHATDVLVSDADETVARLNHTARLYEQVDIFPA